MNKELEEKIISHINNINPELKAVYIEDLLG